LVQQRFKDSRASSAANSKRNSINESSNTNAGVGVGANESSSSLASKLASSFGWLRKQNSEILPWWMPSTDNVPAITATSAETADEDEMALDQLLHTGTINMSGGVVGKVDDETSTSSADETHEESSTSTEEEEQTDQSNKRDDTDVELDDLPVEKEPTSPSDDGDKVVAVELGDRSSPDGFEWPDCPVTPPLKRSFSPLYRRPPSPYDNVLTAPVVHTTWGLDALRSLESSAVVTTRSDDSHDNNNEEEEGEESDESSEEEEQQQDLREKGKQNKNKKHLIIATRTHGNIVDCFLFFSHFPQTMNALNLDSILLFVFDNNRGRP